MFALFCTLYHYKILQTCFYITVKWSELGVGADFFANALTAQIFLKRHGMKAIFLDERPLIFEQA